MTKLVIVEYGNNLCPLSLCFLRHPIAAQLKNEKAIKETQFEIASQKL
jgi:hypothetical protein